MLARVLALKAEDVFAWMEHNVFIKNVLVSTQSGTCIADEMKKNIKTFK
jgi:hypothetical protein